MFLSRKLLEVSEFFITGYDKEVICNASCSSDWPALMVRNCRQPWFLLATLEYFNSVDQGGGSGIYISKDVSALQKVFLPCKKLGRNVVENAVI